MNPTTAFLLLLSFTIVWFLLPLIPAIRELLRPTDITPLQVVDRDAADVSLFARRFREYLTQQLQTLPAESAGETEAVLNDGTPVFRGRKLPDSLRNQSLTTEGLRHLVVFNGPTALPGGELFLNEIFTTHSFVGGPQAVYRAILGDAGITLGPSSTVLRWVHARTELLVGDGSTLAGRASADTAIRMGAGVSFDRLSAPRIVVGGGAELVEVPAANPVEFALPDEGVMAIGDHHRVEGDLTIPAGALLRSDLVVTGNVRLDGGAQLVGSLKAHGDVHLADGAVVDGAVVTRQRVVTGLRAVVGGPIIAEDEVALGPGTVIGQQHYPTSIAAPRISLARGVVVHGLVTSTSKGGTEAYVIG